MGKCRKKNPKITKNRGEMLGKSINVGKRWKMQKKKCKCIIQGEILARKKIFNCLKIEEKKGNEGEI